MNSVFNRHLVCPYCNKGEILADAKVKASISVMCPKCRKFYIGDLDNLKTSKGVAQRRVGRHR